MSNTANSIVSGVVSSVESAVGANAKVAAQAAEVKAATEVSSLSTHWHIPVWAVLAVLAVGAWVFLHYVL